MPDTLDELLTRAKEIRKDILKMTTEAGSGHPSSSMSAAEFVTARSISAASFATMRRTPSGPIATGSSSRRAMPHRCSTRRWPKRVTSPKKRS